jgi:hypothetical protein
MSRICRIRHTKCNIHMGWSQQLLYIHKINKSFLDKKILLTGYFAFFTSAKYTVLWFEVLRWRYSRSHKNILYFFLLNIVTMHPAQYITPIQFLQKVPEIHRNSIVYSAQFHLSTRPLRADWQQQRFYICRLTSRRIFFYTFLSTARLALWQADIIYEKKNTRELPRTGFCF